MAGLLRSARRSEHVTFELQANTLAMDGSDPRR
jgi:hypothetical protein